MPESAVAWFADASPKVQQTIASGATLGSTPSRRARARANAVPVAFGRCDAIVLVCGGTQSGRLPQTLWRPPAIGSLFDAQIERSVSKSGVDPGSRRARAIMSAPAR